MSGERQSLLGNGKPYGEGGRRRQYTDSEVGKLGAPGSVLEMTESGSSTGVRISSSVRTPRLSDAFENSGIYQIALSWKDISVKVNIPGKKRLPFREHRPTTQKTILQNITGVASPGCLLAIMGASGSGKSTLLNTLTQRNTKDYLIEGEMMLNGVPLTPGAIKNVSAYVQQSDLFMETLTVREQLQFRAMLRMNNKLDKDERMKRVEAVITEMGLTGCANTRIGGASGTKKGISGGERKRLSFASEALTNPPIFFCDEPTSSLDSFMALSIVHTLQTMALRGRVILCTIHQPSSELFAMFTQVLILSEGRVAFMGHSKDCLDFFYRQNYPCPSNYNPGDHYILTLAIVPGREVESRKRSQEICDEYDRSDAAKDYLYEIKEQKKNVDMYDHVMFDKVTGESRYSTTLASQASNLLWRAWICQFRDPMIFYVRMAQVLILALLMSLIYFDSHVTQKGIMNINGAMYLLIVNLTGSNLFAVLTSFPTEMSLVRREYGSGLYSTVVYFVTKSLAELPLNLFTSGLFMSIAYWMIGLRDTFEAFFIATGVAVASTLIAVYVGYTISIVSGDSTLALAVAGPVLVPLMLFSGMMLNIDDIPDPFKWMKELSWFRNCYQLMMVNQWKDRGSIACPDITDIPYNSSLRDMCSAIFCPDITDTPYNSSLRDMCSAISCPDITDTPYNSSLRDMCSAISCPYRSGQNILDYNSMKDDRAGDIGHLVAQAGGFYLLALVAIVIRTRQAME